jgi:hypothetical protein
MLSKYRAARVFVPVVCGGDNTDESHHLCMLDFTWAYT